MQVVQDGDRLDADRSTVTLGVFDGVHRGHQELVRTARRVAATNGGPTVVLLLDRNPLSVTDPSHAPKVLTHLRQRLELLDELGVDITYLLRFDEERSLTPAREFIAGLLVDTLRTATFVSGADQRFGHRARGDIRLLEERGGDVGIDVVVVPDVVDDHGEVVSSTAIRRLVADGDLDRAAGMLGRPFELRGVVEPGDARGRTIGFPTANVAVAGDSALPRGGVYAGWYLRPDGSRHAAAVNIGRRPTFYDENGLLLVEAHLLDFEGDLYGERPRVQFVARLRDEQRFDGLDALRTQLAADVARTRELLGT